MNKVELVEETEYDQVVQCDHSYDRRCHTTYITSYEAQQQEQCEDNYKKKCFIDYDKIAFNETVKICRRPLVKQCDIDGPEICSIVYESECWTKQVRFHYFLPNTVKSLSQLGQYDWEVTSSPLGYSLISN